jgi:hypothetical protein
MKKQIYTEKIHARKLIEILEKEDTCNKCLGATEKWIINDNNHPCDICRSFIGLTEQPGKMCPCISLGKEKAIEITYEVLKSKGYVS